MNKALSTTILCSLALLAGSACTEAESAEDFRMLPVALVTDSGTDVFVGTYDESTRELVLLPEFVRTIEAELGEELSLAVEAELQALDVELAWESALEVGSPIFLVEGADAQTSLSGVLVVQDAEWTDGLSEAEARSLYADCEDEWDALMTVCEIC